MFRVVCRYQDNVRAKCLRSVQIYETAGFSTRRIVQLFAAIPEANKTTANITLEDMKFVSEMKIAHPHDGVGSGKTQLSCFNIWCMHGSVLTLFLV